MISKPLLMIVSAPSGAGKTTLCNMLMAEFPSIVYSVSCTTRAPRGAEQDGKDYFFLDEPEFRSRIEAGDFLEHACVHGNLYGTLKTTILETMRDGKDVLLDIDVQGAAQIRNAIAQLDETDPLRAGFTDIFIAPPSMEELSARLNGRGTDAADVIAKRLAQAAAEMESAPLYRHRIVNDRLEEAYNALKAVYLQEKQSI